MAIHLTERAIREFVVPRTRKSILITDLEQPGFAVQKTQTGNMAYIIRYRNAEGKQRQEKIATVGSITTAAARALAKSLLRHIEESKGGRPTHSHRVTAPLMDDFFHHTFLPRVQLASRSSSNHVAIYRNHIAPYFAHLRLNEIDADAVIHFANHLKTKVVANGRWQTQATRTLSDGTVKRILILLRHIFNTALRQRYTPIDHNPTSEISLTSERKIVGIFLTPPELQRLLHAAESSPNPDLANILRVLLGTGLRRANVLAMRWEWFDAKRGVLTIPAEKNKAKKDLVLPLSEAVHALLQRLQKNAISPTWVFCNPRTQRPYLSCRNAWVSTREKAGLPTLRLHDLRHTYASMLLDSGANLIDVQLALGHANVSTTQVYTHSSDLRKRQRANAAAAVMGVFG